MHRTLPGARAMLFALLTLPTSAAAQDAPDREAFVAALPGLRARIAAGDWQGFTAAARTFAAVPFDRLTRDKADDLLVALNDLGVHREAPTAPWTRGILADCFGAAAVADACYQEHLANGPAMAFGPKSVFLGYRARLAVQRGDLVAAARLLTEQQERRRGEPHGADPAFVQTLDAQLRAVRALAAAPHDAWLRLALVRDYWQTAYPPLLSSLLAVRAELERVLADPAVAKDRALALAIRCEQLDSFPSVEAEVDPRVLAVAVRCVDDGLLPAAGQRRDVAEPWWQVLTIGTLLQKANDPARALVAFDAFVAGVTSAPFDPAYVTLLHTALVAGAECAVDGRDGAGAVRRLDRAEREFPYERGAGTGDPSAAQRIAKVRERVHALTKR